MPQPEFKTAHEVSEHLLKVTGDALMQRDFEAFAQAFRLPLKMTTAQSEIKIGTLAELRSCFDQTCTEHQLMRITELKRVCEAATFRGPDRVEATHTSHMISDGHTLMPPYPVFSVLERTNGCWQITAADYALNDDVPHARAMLPKPASDETAVAIYQDHLDRTTDALMRGSFAAFTETISLPHRMQTETATQVVETLAEMETAFYKFSDKYRDIGVTDFVRIAKEAYFHADDDIRGIHESHLIRYGTRLIPPYPNRVRLKRFADGQWRETHCANAILNGEGRFHLWAEVADDPHLPDLDIDPERTKT